MARRRERSASSPAGGAGPPRRTRLRTAWLSVFAAVGAAALIYWLVPGGAPSWNILLISVDTLRADHLGFAGYDRPTSPRLDGLARDGIVFSQAICQNTNTNPSHASMLTGLYPRTHGNLDNYYMMADDVTLAPEVLRRRGWRTAAFVSGYTLKARICRLDRGFDVYDDDFSGKERRGDRTTDQALAWLRTHAADPFFLFVHLFDPHGPYDPPAGAPEFVPRTPPRVVPLERIPRYQRLPSGVPESDIWTDLERYKARYDSEIAFADEQVGRLLDTVAELGLDDRTIVVFTSDHGEALDERFHLLDHGGGIGDEEIRVPLVIRLPQQRHAGKRFDPQVQTIDILPTLVALLGRAWPAPMQGVDLMPLLDGAPVSPHPYALTETRLIPFRWRDRPYVLSRRDTLKALRRSDAKLVVFPGAAQDHLELFDLAADPLERTDLHAARPEETAAMRRELARFVGLPSRVNAVADPDSDDETRDIFRSLGYID